MNELDKRCTETLIQYYGRLLWISSEVHKCDGSLFRIELEKRIEGTRAELKRCEALSFSPWELCRRNGGDERGRSRRGNHS